MRQHSYLLSDLDVTEHVYVTYQDLDRIRLASLLQPPCFKKNNSKSSSKIFKKKMTPPPPL